MSSGRGRSPCDTGPRELRLDVICPGTLAAVSRRNDGPNVRPYRGWDIAPRYLIGGRSQRRAGPHWTATERGAVAVSGQSLLAATGQVVLAANMPSVPVPL